MVKEDLLFLETIDDLTSSLRSFGVHTPFRPKNLDGSLNRIPSDAKFQIRKALSSYLDIIRTPVPANSEPELSLGHFEIFRRVAGIRLADPDFMRNFNEGDICEAYTPMHQQIFRNLEFFKTCSYDLFTMTVVPWNELFTRPESVRTMIMELAEKILLEKMTSVAHPIPDHVIQECYGSHKKSFLYSLKQAGALLDSVTNEPKGYVTIIRVHELEEAARPGMIN